MDVEAALLEYPVIKRKIDLLEYEQAHLPPAHENSSQLAGIHRELKLLQDRLNRLEFIVSQLREDEAKIIRKRYFEGKTWRELENELQMSSRTLLKRRDRALESLAGMLRYLDGIKNGDHIS